MTKIRKPDELKVLMNAVQAKLDALRATSAPAHEAGYRRISRAGLRTARSPSTVPFQLQDRQRGEQRHICGAAEFGRCLRCEWLAVRQSVFRRSVYVWMGSTERWG